MKSVITKACVLVAPLLLGSCGGGGGGSGGDVRPAVLTLSQGSLTFSAQTEAGLPTFQQVTMHVGGPIEAVALNADGGGPLPDWLEIDGIFLDAETLELTVRIARTDLVESTYTSLITFYGLSGNDTVRAQTTLQVTYHVAGRVEILDTTVVKSLVWGHPTTTLTLPVTIAALGEQWQLTSDAEWLSFNEGIQVDSGVVDVEIDADALDAPGNYQATLRITNVDEPDETDTLSIFLSLEPPRFSFSVTTLGGTDGYDESAQPLAFKLNTGTNIYPWTASVSDTSPWVLIERSSGAVGGTDDAMAVDAERAGLQSGVHVGSIRFETQVKGLTFTGLALVRLNIEENQIYVIDDGLALYELPGRARLSAELPVRESRGRSDTPWTATSDQPWLTVTPAGTTSDSLALSADTTALAADSVHVATVTIVPGDASVHNAQEQVTVAMWKSSTPPADLALELEFERIAANPVFPYIHVLAADVVSTYNIYTGALISSTTLPEAQWSNLGVASNGRTLVLPEADTFSRTFVDVQSGAISEVTNGTIGYSASPERLRIKGHSYTLTWPCCALSDPARAVTLDGRLTFGVDTIHWMTPLSHNLSGVALDHSALTHFPLVGSSLGSSMIDTGSVAAMALAEDRRSLLLATTEPSEFRLVDGITRQRVWTKSVVGTPNNALVRQDGLLIAGAATMEGLPDVWVLAFDGTVLAEHSSPTGTLLDNELELGSDRHRLLVPTDANRLSILELPPLGPSLAP